jgi:hypothetical protein
VRHTIFYDFVVGNHKKLESPCGNPSRESLMKRNQKQILCSKTGRVCFWLFKLELFFNKMEEVKLSTFILVMRWMCFKWVVIDCKIEMF